MASQRIRPSLADLYDEPAFPELESGQAPAARVVRDRPPAIAAGSLPPPIPIVSPGSTDADSAVPPPKPKSRFALLREKEAAARTAKSAQRFELDLDEDRSEASERGGGALPRAGGRPSLVKGVVERPVGVRPNALMPPTAPGLPRPSPLDSDAQRPKGFPSSSRGLFPRKTASATPAAVQPGIIEAFDHEVDTNAENDSDSVDGLLASVSRENEDVLRGMSEAQILEEQRQIREELGLSEGILRMLQARGSKRGTRPPAKTALPQRTRPAPGETPASPAPTGPIRETVGARELDEEEEGSPEYIRRHFFPNEPPNPALDWMKPPVRKPDGAADISRLTPAARLTFDIRGQLLDNETAEVPSVAHDHHVSSSTAFTIPSLLSLTASSVPSQRSTAFSILSRIVDQGHMYASRFGEQEWQALRIQAAERAGWALRDPNLGVVGASASVLSILLSQDATSPTSRLTPRVEGAMEPATVASTLLATNPLPIFASQLSVSALPRPALEAILFILTSLVQSTRDAPASAEFLESVFDSPSLLESIVSAFVAVPYPHTAVLSAPSPAALAFLALLARTSRSRASLLCTRGLVDPTLRFLAVPPWELPSSSAQQRVLGDTLLRGTIELWAVLARYGLATDLRGKAAPLLDGLIERIGELRRGVSYGSKTDTAWVSPFLCLLGLWTTAAVDPHVTGHDVTWTQVEGFRDVALDAYELGFALGTASGQGKEVLGAAIELLGSWLEGSKVNRSWRGQEEREWLRQTIGGDFVEGGRVEKLVDQALVALAGKDAQDREGWALFAVRALRLSAAYADTIDPATPHLLPVDAALAGEAARGIAGQPSGSPSLALSVFLLQRLDLSARLSATVNLLPALGVQDAVAARDLIDWLISVVAKSANHTLSPFAVLDEKLEIPALAKVGILRPFLTHAIVAASGGRVVGPLFPTPRDVKLTACLVPFAPTGRVLSPTWPLVALSELLNSGSSPVFQRLPKNWGASELQLVQTSLALMHFVNAASENVAQVERNAPGLIYDLIKVFMLEKDASGTTKGDSGADAEIFRDEGCHASMSALLADLSIGMQTEQQLMLSDVRPARATIEGVSAVVSSAPFYQLYTDLIGLYDSISLSNRLFGLILLPPLAMAYPVDYRRLLWTDYAHILPTLHFSIDEAITDVGRAGALSAFLCPAESNEIMLAAYVDALVAGRVSRERSPFLHLVALHHVATAIFDTTSPGAKSAEKLAKALVTRGATTTLSQIVRYRQGTEGTPVVLPPSCFEPLKANCDTHIARLNALVGKDMFAKVDDLVQ